MIPARSFKEMEALLGTRGKFEDGHIARGVPLNAKTVGFLLFDQNFDRAAANDLVQNLDTLNLRSGTHIHFFLCGVSHYGRNGGESEATSKEFGRLNGTLLYHNARAAETFVDAFMKYMPGWDYDVGTELILVDLTTDGDGRRLDFTSAVYFKIDELIRVGIIDRPSELIGKVIKFARNSKLVSAKAFRTELRLVFGSNWIRGAILAMFPNSVKKLAQAQAVLGGGSALLD